jgi:hypothetical protein
MNKFFPSDPPAVKAGYQHTLEERSPLLDEQFVDEAYVFLHPFSLRTSPSR